MLKDSKYNAYLGQLSVELLFLWFTNIQKRTYFPYDEDPLGMVRLPAKEIAIKQINTNVSKTNIQWMGKWLENKFVMKTVTECIFVLFTCTNLTYPCSSFCQAYIRFSYDTKNGEYEAFSEQQFAYEYLRFHTTHKVNTALGLVLFRATAT